MVSNPLFDQLLLIALVLICLLVHVGLPHSKGCNKKMKNYGLSQSWTAKPGTFAKSRRS